MLELLLKPPPVTWSRWRPAAHVHTLLGCGKVICIYEAASPSSQENRNSAKQRHKIGVGRPQ